MRREPCSAGEQQPAYIRHAPSTHFSAPGHRLLHSPQCCLLVLVSRHSLLQSLRPSGQTHMPPSQVRPSSQTVPQAPQFWSLVCRSVQMPLQNTLPAGQVHMLATQVLPPSHFFPQAPQFRMSDSRRAHVPLHWVYLAGQPELHVPLWQTGVFAGQARPHWLQFAGSVWVLVQAPLHSVRPPAHLHEPASQVRAAVQVVPQVPQLASSVCVSTQ
jgi:hypothetical protein